MRPVTTLLLCSTLIATTGCPKRVTEGGQIDCNTDVKYQGRALEGQVNVGKYGAAGKTEIKAVRQIDQVVERYLARWKSMCAEYNAGVYTAEQYRAETSELRAQMERLDALIIQLESAPDAESYQMVLREMYKTIVPSEERVELELDFAVVAAGPSGPAKAVSNGATLSTGTKVHFLLRPTANAYLYLYQKNAKGEVTVLFPDQRIGVANPVPAGKEVRIPPEPASFKLNAEDLGTEKVEIIASLQPLGSLETSLAKTGVTADELDCNARGLEYDSGGQGKSCAAPRGLEYDAGDAASPSSDSGYSLHAATAAGDSQINRTFVFQHVQ